MERVLDEGGRVRVGWAVAGVPRGRLAYRGSVLDSVPDQIVQMVALPSRTVHAPQNACQEKNFQNGVFFLKQS